MLQVGARPVARGALTFDLCEPLDFDLCEPYTCFPLPDQLRVGAKLGTWVMLGRGVGG